MVEPIIMSSPDIRAGNPCVIGTRIRVTEAITSIYYVGVKGTTFDYPTLTPELLDKFMRLMTKDYDAVSRAFKYLVDDINGNQVYYPDINKFINLFGYNLEEDEKTMFKLEFG